MKPTVLTVPDILTCVVCGSEVKAPATFRIGHLTICRACSVQYAEAMREVRGE